VDKFLSKHPKTAKKFARSMKEIIRSPFKNSYDIKSIKGLNNHYRLRIGKYRFLYEIMEDKIFIYIYDADSRGDIFR
jgi:mRNA interferase RelE/StbE